jgi:3-hydroxyisobutyrate dehydrogenase-like beta-hydroxyacid dehydrogenase
MTDTKTAFIGLGVMGYPMAGHLKKAGYEVTVNERDPSKSEAWVKEHGGALGKTPAEAVDGCDLVFACVGTDDDLRGAVYGDDGILAGMRKGAIFVDHTTASATVAREIDAAAREKGLGFLDAPVSGGQAGAENGALTIMVGGEQATFDKAEPAIQSYARAVTLLGPAGNGQLTKMVNQICLGGLLQALSEALNFAQRAGLDPKLVIETISKGAAQSWQMDNRALTMIDDKYDFGFAVDWMRKDLGMCFDEARRNGARLPVTVLVDQFYAAVQERGGNRWDTSSLMRLLTTP